MRATLTSAGIAETLELLGKTLPERIDDAADEALEAGGTVLLDGMLRRVPRDTNNLADNLGLIGPLRFGNMHLVYVGLNRDVDRATAIYGAVQEYGAAKANIAAQPYIRPTIRSDMGKARRAMIAVLLRAMEVGS